jgi:hypothetical protein
MRAVVYVESPKAADRQNANAGAYRIIHYGAFNPLQSLRLASGTQPLKGNFFPGCGVSLSNRFQGGAVLLAVLLNENLFFGR